MRKFAHKGEFSTLINYSVFVKRLHNVQFCFKLIISAKMGSPQNGEADFVGKRRNSGASHCSDFEKNRNKRCNACSDADLRDFFYSPFSLFSLGGRRSAMPHILRLAEGKNEQEYGTQEDKP